MSLLPEVSCESLEDWHDYTQTIFLHVRSGGKNPDGDEYWPLQLARAITQM